MGSLLMLQFLIFAKPVVWNVFVVRQPPKFVLTILHVLLDIFIILQIVHAFLSVLTDIMPTHPITFVLNA